MNDAYYMAKAVRLAKKGWYSTHPNPRVGCVLVKNDRIIGGGYHHQAGQPHAEINALQDARDKGLDPRAATAYVTLEPCSHYGKTPPCANALINAGIGRVVVGMVDPNPQVAGQGLKRLQEAGICVTCGVLESSARALNQGFIKRMQTGMPFVLCKTAASLDGQTALVNGESQWITGQDARRDVQRLRAQSDAIVTGIGTVQADNPAMTVRSAQFPIVRQPTRIILDTHLAISPDAKILVPDAERIIFTAVSDKQQADTQKEKIRLLADQGVRVIALPVNAQGRISLVEVLRHLGQLQYNEVMLEAGKILSSSFMQQQLIDEWVLYLAPKLLGSGGRGIFDLPYIQHMSDCQELVIHDLRMVGKDLRLVLKLKNNVTR